MWKIQKGYEYITKTFRIPKHMVQELEDLAAQSNLSVNQLVIQCLDFALLNLDTGEPEK